MSRVQRISPSGKRKMITKTVTFATATVDTGSAVDQAVTVPGSGVGDAILATPRGVWPAGLLIGPNRCFVAGTVQMRLADPTIDAVSPVSQSFGFLLVKGGTLRFSPSGPVKVIFRDITVALGSIPEQSANDYPITVPGAKVNDFIIATPQGVLNPGIGMGPHRCLVNGTVQLRVGNATLGAFALVSQTVRFCLIRPARPARRSPSGASNVLERTVTVDVANVLARTAVDTAIALDDAKVGDTFIITPLGTWPDGLALGPHRCLVDGTVLMRVFNGTGGAVDPASQQYRITIIKDN